MRPITLTEYRGKKFVLNLDYVICIKPRIRTKNGEDDGPTEEVSEIYLHGGAMRSITVQEDLNAIMGMI